MAIKYWIAGCVSEPLIADKEMVEIKHWENMVWHSYTNAYVRYCHWKDGNFKKGIMTQIYLLEVVVDIFDPANNKVTTLLSESAPFQKTVVYNQQKELDKKATKVGKVFQSSGAQALNNYLVQGESLAAGQSMWDDPPPIQQGNPFAPTPSNPNNNYAQPVAEPDWDALFQELHPGETPE